MHPVSTLNLPVILASTSPRRQQLLTLADIDYQTLAVDIDETPYSGELPTAYIERMVSQKALGAAELIKKDRLALSLNSQADESFNSLQLEKIVITADTIGVLPDGRQILVKPNDQQDAFAMWQKMSGNTHTVWTAVQFSVINNDSEIVDQVQLLEKTQVEFIALNANQMHNYWRTGEPQDKAGGYAIQGRGAAWVNAVYGSYTNVVGLPLAQTLTMLDDLQTRYRVESEIS